MQTRLTRGAGILLPIGSLPSRYGIGSLGEEAYGFVDFLYEAGQSYWQVLPVGPTGYGDSPYQSFSAFAGNPYFIDLPRLAAQGLLTNEELAAAELADEEIPYERLYYTRFTTLRAAASRFTADAAFEAFCNEEADWLDDYALYMSIKAQHEEHEWTLWEKPLRLREPQAMARVRDTLADDVYFWKFCQYAFFCQWRELKAYANRKGIQLIGDIPIYVAMDSADVWSAPWYFALDEDRRPLEVAGCPPDYFSEDGQRWGNPIYDWDYMKTTDYAWWKQYLGHALQRYDVVRIDHFRGFESYHSIPYGDKNANKKYNYKHQTLCAYKISFDLSPMDSYLKYLDNREFSVNDVWFIR